MTTFECAVLTTTMIWCASCLGGSGDKAKPDDKTVKIEVLKPRDKETISPAKEVSFEGSVSLEKNVPEPQILVFHMTKGKISYASLSLKVGDDNELGRYVRQDASKYSFEFKVKTPDILGKFQIRVEGLYAEENLNVTRVNSPVSTIEVKR